MQNGLRRAGFTLIELLIVIAIIAILALIAIPNFIEAQTRAKVSRVHADMRSVGTGIEAYFVDNNAYPLGHTEWSKLHAAGITTWKPDLYQDLFTITTPLAYLTTIPIDPFTETGAQVVDGSGNMFRIEKPTFSYEAWRRIGGYPIDAIYRGDLTLLVESEANPTCPVEGFKWALVSYGPAMNSRRQDALQYNMYLPRILTGIQPHGTYNPNVARDYPLYIYDPTNGTISQGFIIRTNKGVYKGENRGE